MNIRVKASSGVEGMGTMRETSSMQRSPLIMSDVCSVNESKQTNKQTDQQKKIYIYMTEVRCQLNMIHLYFNSQ